MKQERDAKVITWVFLGILFVLAGMGIVSADKGFSDSENRFLAGKPEFTWEKFLTGRFGAEYEEYLSDQFPGREGWIGVKTAAELLRGRRDVNGVYLGAGGYLMERFDAEDIETVQMEENLERLAAFSAAAAGRLGSGHVRVMLVPSASQIMGRGLPALAAPYDQSRPVDSLRRLLREEAVRRGAVEEDFVVRVEEALARDGREELYYRTDHHWTARGAYCGYRAWAESAGLKPWPEEAFEIETVSRDFYGTIYSKLNIPWHPDTIELYLPREAQQYRVFYDGGEEPRDTLYDRGALAGKDKYAVYLNGNHGLTEIRNESVPAERRDKRLLIVKDSFAHSFAPFVANHFGAVYMADLRYLNVNLDEFMEEKGITDVLVLYQIPGFSAEKTVSKLKLAETQRQMGGDV